MSYLHSRRPRTPSRTPKRAITSLFRLIFKFKLFPEDIDMTGQLGSISPLRLETVLECEVITDLRRGKSKKRKTGAKKIIGSRHLRTTVKEEVVDHGEGDDDVGAEQEVEGKRVNIESIEIKRCELILSGINLAKPEGLEVIKPRLSQAPQRVGGPLNGLNR